MGGEKIASANASANGSGKAPSARARLQAMVMAWSPSEERILQLKSVPIGEHFIQETFNDLTALYHQ